MSSLPSDADASSLRPDVYRGLKAEQMGRSTTWSIGGGATAIEHAEETTEGPQSSVPFSMTGRLCDMVRVCDCRRDDASLFPPILFLTRCATLPTCFVKHDERTIGK